IPRHATGTLSARIHEDPTYRLAWTLTRHFQTLVIHRRGAAALAAWCRAAEASGVPAFQRFAETLRADWDAVVAGISLPWSQGPVEGLNNRTKTLKRMMYGRARLPLLSARILHR
ncbi:transposase, partial [Sulfobacillus harzensis]